MVVVRANRAREKGGKRQKEKKKKKQKQKQRTRQELVARVMRTMAPGEEIVALGMGCVWGMGQRFNCRLLGETAWGCSSPWRSLGTGRSV